LPYALSILCHSSKWEELSKNLSPEDKTYIKNNFYEVVSNKNNQKMVTDHFRCPEAHVLWKFYMRDEEAIRRAIYIKFPDNRDKDNLYRKLINMREQLGDPDHETISDIMVSEEVFKGVPLVNYDDFIDTNSARPKSSEEEKEQRRLKAQITREKKEAKLREEN
jgi:hypothetical protein